MTDDRHSQEAGFTLVELLVGIAMALVITMAAVSMFTSMTHKQPEVTRGANLIGTARNAVEKMSIDIRGGERATLLSPSQLDLTTTCQATRTSPSESCEVKYRCQQEAGQSTSSCTRQVGTKTRTVVRGLASSNVFCVYPTAEPTKECGVQGTAAVRYVGVDLEFPGAAGARCRPG